MYAQNSVPGDNKGRVSSKRKNKTKQSARITDNRKSAVIQIPSAGKTTIRNILDRRKVALVTKVIKNVIFDGSASLLRAMLLNVVPEGICVEVTAGENDGSYDVEFTNNDGTEIAQSSAREWVNKTLLLSESRR